MILSWTIDQVLSFAPDPATAKRGQALASERQWRTLEGNERAIWGECKSSSVTYYKTQVDLSGPGFQCNCPSRKFPCKHTIALLLIFISRSEAFFIREDMPTWVAQWLATRGDKTAQNSRPAATAERLEKNANLRSKNRLKRLEEMKQGVKDLETWLLDLTRQGLASTEQLEYAYWQDIAARMVDNKLAGVGLKIRSLPLLQGGNTDWPEQMLSELAELYLLARGLENLENLPEPMQEQILSVAGLYARQEDLQHQPGIDDHWLILGQFTGVNIDNGTYRRTWLVGLKTGKKALLLEYDYRGNGFSQDWPVGAVVKGEAVYYPGSFPLRVLLRKWEFLSPKNVSFQSHPDIPSFLEEYGRAVAANPWLLEFPACLNEVIPAFDQEELHLVDRDKKSIPLASKDTISWKLMALSGGHPVTVFGEWTGRRLIPLSVLIDGRLLSLST